MTVPFRRTDDVTAVDFFPTPPAFYFVKISTCKRHKRGVRAAWRLEKHSVVLGQVVVVLLTVNTHPGPERLRKKMFCCLSWLQSPHRAAADAAAASRPKVPSDKTTSSLMQHG